MTRRHLAAVTVALVAVLVAACVPSDEVEIPAAAPGAVRGGTLRIGSLVPASIDPGNVHDDAGRLLVRTMCDPLIQFDAETGEPKPALAESWQVSDRGKKLTLRVRKGARFSDGSDVTADDVRFSLTRLASADFASFESDLVSRVVGYSFVHGDEDTDNEELRRTLRGVKVIEGNSVEIELTTEFTPFVRVLGHPAATPVPRRLAERDPVAFERRPVCAGPYQMARPWRPGDDRIVLQRSARHEAANAGYTAGGAGYADAVEFVLFPDLDAQRRAFEAGELDVAELPAAAADEVRGRAGADVLEAVTPAVEYVGVPTGTGLYEDAAVRRALSVALDRRAVAAAAVAGGAGGRTPATGFLPPTLGRELHRPDPCGDALDPTADPERARAMLADAGVSLDGATLVMHFNDEFGNAAVAAAVADQWRSAFGLDVQLRPMPWQDFLSTGMAPDGFAGAFRVSWEATHPDPDHYLAPLFSSEGMGDANFAKFTDPEFERRLTFAARRALDVADEVVEYRRLEDFACSSMPMIPVTFGVDHFAIAGDRVTAAPGRALDVTAGAPAVRELHLRAAP